MATRTKAVSEVAAALYAALRERGYSYLTLSQRSGIPRTTIAHLMDGSNPVTVGHLLTIAASVDATPLELLPEHLSPPLSDKAWSVYPDAILALPVEALVGLCARTGLAPCDVIPELEGA